MPNVLYRIIFAYTCITEWVTLVTVLKMIAGIEWTLQVNSCISEFAYFINMLALLTYTLHRAFSLIEQVNMRSISYIVQP